MGEQKPNDVVIQSAALLGVFGAASFVACLLALTLLRPDMDPARRYVSEFARGPYGWMMTASFMTVGAGVVVIAEGLYRATPGARGRTLATVLLTLAGCGLLLMGVFRSDLQGGPYTLQGRIHATLALVTFPCLNGAFLVFASAFRHHHHWRPMHPWALGIGAASAAAVFLFFSLVALTHPLASDLPNRMQGAAQRLAITWSLVWVLVASARLRLTSALPAPGPDFVPSGAPASS